MIFNIVKLILLIFVVVFAIMQHAYVIPAVGLFIFVVGFGLYHLMEKKK